MFHNTRLLLSHYNDLKSHVKNAISDATRLETDFIDIGDIDRDELYILSIKKSKTKTLIMIAHIDVAMEALRNKQHKLCSPEKYEALKMFFIDEMTYEKLELHDKRLNNHVDRLDKLEQGQSEFKVEIKNLCESLKTLTNTMKKFLVYLLIAVSLSFAGCGKTSNS